MPNDFRWLLKDQTSSEHDRLDTLLSALDVSSFDGLAGFLAIHRHCFNAMLPAAVPGDDAFAALVEMIRCIDSDLGALGVECTAGLVPPLGPVHGLALDYVLEGSRLGTKVLRRRWEASDDPRVRAANAYFMITPVPGRWRDVCAALSAVAPDSPEAAQITRDTEKLFALFAQIANDWMSAQGQCRKITS